MPHEERNDALKRNAKIPLDRYRFADEKLPRNITIGDLGCGYGYGSKILRDGGRKVVGIDKEEAIKYVQENYPGDYMVEDLDADYIVYYEFDGIVCLETLLHLKDPKEFLNKLKCKHLIISAAVNTDPNDGYIYRLHNITESEFKDMIFKKWLIVDEMHQKPSEFEHYITLYAKSSNNR